MSAPDKATAVHDGDYVMRLARQCAKSAATRVYSHPFCEQDFDDMTAAAALQIIGCPPDAPEAYKFTAGRIAAWCEYTTWILGTAHHYRQRLQVHPLQALYGDLIADEPPTDDDQNGLTPEQEDMLRQVFEGARRKHTPKTGKFIERHILIARLIREGANNASIAHETGLDEINVRANRKVICELLERHIADAPRVSEKQRASALRASAIHAQKCREGKRNCLLTNLTT